MPTDSAQQALSILRDGSQFQWHVIPLLLLVLYVYANEIERRNWNVVFAGLALFGMDWFNEIWNALVLLLPRDRRISTFLSGKRSAATLLPRARGSPGRSLKKGQM